MNKVDQSKEEIVAEMQEKIAQILSIPTSSIESSRSFWELFPPNSRYIESKEISQFCEFVCNQYKVYLAEREWEASSLSNLAEIIIKKQANPEKVMKQVKEERESRRKGMQVTIFFFMFLVIGGYFLCVGPFERKVTVASFIAVLVSASTGFIFYREYNKFRRETRWMAKQEGSSALDTRKN